MLWVSSTESNFNVHVPLRCSYAGSAISILNIVGQARQVTASSHAVTLSFHPQRS